jgi:hypothetical protein
LVRHHLVKRRTSLLEPMVLLTATGPDKIGPFNLSNRSI